MVRVSVLGRECDKGFRVAGFGIWVQGDRKDAREVRARRGRDHNDLRVCCPHDDAIPLFAVWVWYRHPELLTQHINPARAQLRELRVERFGQVSS